MAGTVGGRPVRLGERFRIILQLANLVPVATLPSANPAEHRAGSGAPVVMVDKKSGAGLHATSTGTEK
jgi:hypothetical protein